MSTELVKGDLLGGKFRIERIVGRGGMGIVVEATNTQIDQKVALKLLARGADDPAVVERFTREAKAAARLKSEHVARVYDVGRDPRHGPFIVMEMLEGKTLAELVKGGRVPLHSAVEHVIDACEGLAEAHARGIVHQDVKPGNLFVVTGEDGKPSIKLLDFGISTMRSNEPERESKSSAPRYQGTPAYLSPEQLRGAAHVDHRADVWALGCVLYELVSAQRAFRATRFTELVTQILEAPPDTLPLDLELPMDVALAIDRCLQKDPAKRWNSTGELAIALLPFARRRAHSSVRRAVAHVRTSGLDPKLEMPPSVPPPAGESGEVPNLSAAPVAVPPTPASSRKSKLPLVALGVFVVGGLGSGGFALAQRLQNNAAVSAAPSASVAAAAPSIEPAASASSAPPSAPPTIPVVTAAPSDVSSKPASPKMPAKHDLPPRPHPSASSGPASPDAEIRTTR